MALKKNDLKQAVDTDMRMKAKPTAEKLKRYTMMLPPALVAAIREHGQVRGKSLATAIREGMVLYAEKEGLM